jgi:hypothetical protein
MKPTDKPKLSEDWWDEVRPDGLKDCDLDDLLPDVEEALAEQRKNDDDPDAIDECLDLLQDVPAAAAKTAKQCDKQKDKVLIAVLGKYGAVVKEESSRLEKLKKQLEKEQSDDDDDKDDDDENENKLFDKDHLYKMVKLLKNGGKQLNFGFGLNTNAPEASRLVLNRKGKPEKLFKALKKSGEFNNRTMTYGVAYADPSDANTLVFKLESGAKEPPRMVELCREFLRSDHGLKFRKVSIVTAEGASSEVTGPGKNKNIV